MKRSLPLIGSIGPWRGPAYKASRTMEVFSPADGSSIAEVEVAGAEEVDMAVAAAQAEFPAWSAATIKRRASIMLRFHALAEAHQGAIVESIMLENGKNRVEATGDFAKGMETVEWACSMPQLAQGKHLTVSSGVTCHEVKEPVGVVASIVPFNFPFMVPFWTLPIALVAGNCVILKPSEKVPMTMHLVADLLYEAGVPRGAFQIVQGTQDASNALCDHPGVQALTFVGSSRVAKLVHDRARAAGKKVIALGGAKNHLVAAPDRDLKMASSDIVASFAGCAGQRCMAASVLITIGDQPELLDNVVARAGKLGMGQEAGQVGPVIDAASRDRILDIVARAEKDGAEVLLDGRTANGRAGTWVGPTILKFPTSMAGHEALTAEIFGPVLSVVSVPTAAEALAIENSDPHGNAACIYTSSGATADFFSRRFNAAMVGVNIGVPVPREPFSFGGMEGSISKYGEHDITGEGALNFFTKVRKVTTKWTTTPDAPPDAANFGGTM
eukprot:CAMPEP_0206000090 /NCGR_PEP_ID=MMETSP1464-20131121/1244_1 /ASSEMBLY_ACC=CAM_ASM_001124 /TAXON_ID=119497 /ORGANISM="Exanthemachrysis gayraliae, Strain RCC1523" /LENGTH=498 /DNA_ID=CAMNT_0053373327 /DNA_START=27 /DNA_END=1523 /DNA_ORIENTATION=+